MILTQTIHCQPARAPLVVRGRTLAHGCCLPHTRTTPYHTSSFTSPVQGRPATTHHHHQPASLRPASLTTAHHPSACPSLCFTLRCAVNSSNNNNSTRRCPRVETACRLCGRSEKSIPERYCGKTYTVVASQYCCWSRQIHLPSETAALSARFARLSSTSLPAERRGSRQNTLLIYFSPSHPV